MQTVSAPTKNGMIRSVAQFGRALRLGRRGHWFKSSLSDLRGRAAVARQPHKLEVGGSNPLPATLGAVPS